MPDYLGAQTTVQRWWADPLLNTREFDRTIRTVFTHDHFGPCSHQHHGLYGALVVEKATASWTALDGSPLGNRPDGGPTSFAANILDGANSFREFNLAFADFAIVYRASTDARQPTGAQEGRLAHRHRAAGRPRTGGHLGRRPRHATGQLPERADPAPHP